MNTRSAFQVALVIVLVVLAVLMLAIAIAKGFREARTRRRAALVAEVRPMVLASIDDDATVNAFSGRRQAAAESVAIALLPKLRGADRAALAQVLEESGMIDRSVAGLRSRLPARRQRSAELVGTAGTVRAVPRLIELMADRDHDVRITAARALGRIGDAESVPALFDALGERRVPANTASMAVLRVGAAGAPGITSALVSPIPRARSIAAELAGSLGLVEARRFIEPLLYDIEPVVQESAARALGRLGTPASVPALIGRLERHLATPQSPLYEGVAVAIAITCGQIGDRASIPVLEASFMRSHRLSAAAADSLAMMGQRRTRASIADRANGSLNVLEHLAESGPVGG